MAETVGFIGLGVMGRPMAKNLLKGGYALLVNSRSPQPVEALVAHGADPTFGDRIRVRGAYWCSDDSDAVGSEDGIEARRELGVAVSDQEPEPAAVVGERHAHVAGVLGDPTRIRVGG